ncbi:type VI secretion system baseplate subunit TssG [uncultured Aquabacterium sp.]|uniref:type VI secretion system baseplate subunit TssG n=1 Tax=uncultured Aquabacterium sp. TaxID=158753 RepID=UPI0026013C57|nr:type VI secretion system baseplate subunit TssG [uncultured Aquabacterium sp.]
MQPAQRRHRAALIDALLTQPQSFSFFQLVRLLDRWLAPADANARGVSKLHFRNSVSLSFPTSEVESLVVRARTSLAEAHDMPGGSDPVAGGLLAQALDETLAAQRSWRAQDVERIEITPAFMGLLGVAGALPLYYTEVLGAREAQHKDHAARAFMDVFSHRAVALFYEAWTKHRLAMRYEQQPQTRFVGEVLALAGLGFDSLRGRAGGLRDEALACQAGTLQRGGLSAVQLQATLSGYLRVPVKVEQFVGRRYARPVDARAGLGVAGAPMQLGRSAALGETVWQRDLRMRLVVGPLSRRRYEQFLPGRPGAQALQSWVHLLAGVHLECEVQLCLAREAVQGMALDSDRAASAGRLGWDSFLSSRPATQDRADVRYELAAHGV